MAISTFRRLLSFIGIAFTVFIINSSLTTSSLAEEFNSLEKEELNKIVKQFILDNPEVILEAVENLRLKQQQAEATQVQERMASLTPQLINDPLSPVAGNLSGDVTIVEFFDYRCSYCKKVRSTLREVMRTDKNIRLVYKEFPILGPESVIAARAALAVWKLDPEKYPDFHNDLMKSRGSFNKIKVLEIAADLGLNPVMIEKEMSNPEIDLAINQNKQLAKALNISGTPAFIIGDDLIPGAIDLATMKNVIKKTRASQGG